MGYQFISVKCPECGADFPLEEGRTMAFCSYCGSKLLVSNENEHIYHTIDEAGIKQAETDRMVKLKMLEMEEKYNNGRKTLIILWLTATAILFAVGMKESISEMTVWGCVYCGV